MLPPSRGMKLMRTPPVGRSAESDVVSIVTSAADPTSGVWPPMLPPACSVIVLMPLAVTRWSVARLPWTVRLPPTS